MPKDPLPMHRIEAVLQCRSRNLSVRRIASSLGLKRSTVSDYLRRAEKAGLSWPLPADVTEASLHEALFGPAHRKGCRRPLPDWSTIHRQLRQKGVTLQLLHDEYLLDYPDGYRYSQFCELYRRFRKSLGVCMRQTYQPGEKLFVDYAGPTFKIIDGATDKPAEAYLFVAVLGASNFTYAEAVGTLGLEDWIGAHCNAFEFFGGVATLTIPDNTKCAVDKPCRYEPVLNRTYSDMAEHYGTCVLPTRPRRPQDKAKVEAGVLVAERWIMAALRKRTFLSLADLNQAIRKLLDKLNRRPFKKLPGCRDEMFRELEQPALQALPATRYEVAEWHTVKVNIDYHVSVYLGERRYHYYSVPHGLIGYKLELRMTRNTVEVFCGRQRVAAHRRSDVPGGYTTVREHMPSAHRRYGEWTPARIRDWAGRTGRACRDLTATIMKLRPHPEQGFRSCMGLISLGKTYGDERLEAACRRAVAFELYSYRSVKNILETNQDKLPLHDDNQPELIPANDPAYLRGPAYYR